MRADRTVHVVVALVATAALVLQLALVLQGGRVLDEAGAPPLGLSLARFVAYFTIQSNVLVALTSWLLARDPRRSGPVFAVVRQAAVLGITVTGLVHLVLLRPLLDLDGADRLADELLHVVVSVLAVAAWAGAGPRGLATPRVALLALAWPVAWTVETLVVGGLTGWYPYPFLDHREDGVGAVAVAVAGITVLFVALDAALVALDRRLPHGADSTP